MLDLLKADHQFLLDGGVSSKGLTETWIEHKRKAENHQTRLRSHPYEF